MNIITKGLRYVLNKDAHILAPKLSWRTSLIGAKSRFLLNNLKDTIKPNPIGKKFQTIMATNPTAQQVQEACDLFTKATGIKMIMTNPKGAISFSNLAHTILRDIKDGSFPKDIKYIIFGHGNGTTLNNTWHVANDPSVKIFDFIKKNIPKGEKVLVDCCEETPKELRHLIPKSKPAIGKVVTELESSYHTPAKIVKSGTDEIIGGYANGIASYYI